MQKVQGFFLFYHDADFAWYVIYGFSLCIGSGAQGVYLLLVKSIICNETPNETLKLRARICTLSKLRVIETVVFPIAVQPQKLEKKQNSS